MDDNNIFSIITQVIIEILALSLAKDGVIFRYNYLRRGDFSGRTNFLKMAASRFVDVSEEENEFNEGKCHSEEYQTRYKVRNDSYQR